MDEKVRDAAKMYEKLFMREMLKAMRSTVHESGFIKQNQAEKIFQDELDSETVDSWSERRGGVGLADLIYQNLTDRYGAQMGLKAPVTPPKGPIALDAKSEFGGVARVASPKSQESIFKFERTPGTSGAQELTMPWDGTLSEKKDLGDGSYLLGFTHDHGLSGRLVFRGTPERLEMGHSVRGGERVGLLSPEARAFFWTLAPQAAPAADSKAEIVSE